MPFFPIFSGILLLVSGRRLFWLIIAILGFIFSYQFVQQQIPELSANTAIIVGVLLGIGGAILAVFIQKLAIALAGFLAGGMIATYVWQSLGQTGDAYFLVFLLGGIAGCIFMVIIFDWALIILTALTGASLLVQVFNLEQQGINGIAFLALAFAGIFIQAWHSPPKGRRRNR